MEEEQLLREVVEEEGVGQWNAKAEEHFDGKTGKMLNNKWNNNTTWRHRM